MSEEIVNKVSQSQLVQIDLDDFLPKSRPEAYDLAQNLYQGLVLREKDFRQFINEFDWLKYQHKRVAVFCSADAIVPNWAYMLIASKMNAVGAKCSFGSVEEVMEKELVQSIKDADLSSFKNKKVLIKGCGSFELSPFVYVEITTLLQPLVNSLMFGEACSTVPVYKMRQ